ncbi:hypothetical protein M758_12G177000 [Ceratodon purpureus]|nr:hypothetical protein M758_12G177000 [Ceratodon purpureus]
MPDSPTAPSPQFSCSCTRTQSSASLPPLQQPRRSSTTSGFSRGSTPIATGRSLQPIRVLVVVSR